MHTLKSKLIPAMACGSCRRRVRRRAAQERAQTKQTVAMSQQVYEKLPKVQELIEEQGLRLGPAVHRELKECARAERLRAGAGLELSGYSYYLQERYADAIRAYDQVLRPRICPKRCCSAP
jgi:hypothetical protein